VFGINQAQGKAALSTNCRAVLLHAGEFRTLRFTLPPFLFAPPNSLPIFFLSLTETRKNTYKGVISSNAAPSASASVPLDSEPKKDSKKRGLQAETDEPDTKRAKIAPKEKTADVVVSSEIQDNQSEHAEDNEDQAANTEETGDPSFIPF